MEDKEPSPITLKVVVSRVAESFMSTIVLMSLVVNLYLTSVLKEESRERVYVEVSSGLNAVVFVIWVVAACAKKDSLWVAGYAAGAVVAAGSGLTLGVIGVLLLLREDLKADETAGAVILTAALQWLLGIVEFLYFLYYFVKLRESASVSPDPVDASQEMIAPENSSVEENPQGESEEVSVNRPTEPFFFAAGPEQEILPEIVAYPQRAQCAQRIHVRPPAYYAEEEKRE